MNPFSLLSKVPKVVLLAALFPSGLVVAIVAFVLSLLNASALFAVVILLLLAVVSYATSVFAVSMFFGTATVFSGLAGLFDTNAELDSDEE